MAIPPEGLHFKGSYDCPKCGEEAESVSLFRAANCLTVGWGHCASASLNRYDNPRGGGRRLCITRHAPWPAPLESPPPAPLLPLIASIAEEDETDIAEDDETDSTNEMDHDPYRWK